MNLVPANQTQTVPALGGASSFDLLVRQADLLATSRIIPRAYQGRSADVIAAGLAGFSFGWDVMTSLRNYHVIEGTASLRPEAMLGLVRRAGHSVQLVLEGEGEKRCAIAKGRRADNGDEHSSRFAISDAKTAGLAGKSNWKNYGDSMLTWRAVSALCRVLFPDVVLGAGYIPEEIGAEVGADGVPVEEDPFSETLLNAGQAKRKLVEACGGDLAKAKQVWGDRGSSSISQDNLDALIATIVLDDEIIEAEIVEEATQPTEAITKRATLGSRAKSPKSSEAPSTQADEVRPSDSNLEASTEAILEAFTGSMLLEEEQSNKESN